MTLHPPHAVARRRLTVRGIVQGVGFRPFVYGLAARWALTGQVGNNSAGVFIEIEGDTDRLDAFCAALISDAPPLAQIETVAVESIPTCGDSGFTILASQPGAAVSALIPPDLAICDDCLRELFDPADRRYRYPFINCTHCGPRFTIIQQLPYDRAVTTMSGFALCPDCAAEYDDPLNRRFHAQPNACPICGPKVWVYPTQNADPISAAQAALRAGQIVAVKGLGGFHIACDATSDQAVMTLRQRKGRSAKPFAVMVRDLDAARQIAHISDAEADLLTSRERPILLLNKRADYGLSEQVAPGNPSIGIMLPYTPLHYLLLDERPLVMTSGNLSGEPICTDNDDALTRLAPLVDVFLLHNRPIHLPCDDSVIRVYDGRALPIRRSRGYTPLPVRLPFPTASVLATGGELKNTFCLTHAGYAFLSQHLGDMENIETLAAFERAYGHFRDLYQVQPQAVICDLHPGYLTTRWAEQYARAEHLPLIRVQHHHAHIAALLAEHADQRGQDHPVIGVCFDGTGWGTDGAIWGGEVLIADYADFRRAAHLAYIPLAGGDAAVKRPYRVALAYLWAAGIAWAADLPPVQACPPAEQRILARQFETGFQTVPCSSMGRLFDAVAALIGLRQTVSYEAQAAIELEGICGDLAERDHSGYHFALTRDASGMVIMDAAPVIAGIVTDLRAGVAAALIAARFHDAVAALIVEVCGQMRADGAGAVVALTGGVFQNVRLLDAAVRRLRADGFTVITHQVVPPNDGGLALGQAMIGARRMSEG